MNVSFVSVPPAETLPHEENGLIKEQRYMDSASNSMTPRPQTVRSLSEYHSQAGSLYHPGNSTLMRRLSSNPTELSSSQPLRRVEGTVTVKRIWILHFFLPCVFAFKQYRARGSAVVLNTGLKITPVWQSDA